jgi:hypothetical protein
VRPGTDNCKIHPSVGRTREQEYLSLLNKDEYLYNENNDAIGVTEVTLLIGSFSTRQAGLEVALERDAARTRRKAA